jgi:hypothetical protein
VAIICLVLSTLPVLNVVAIALFTLHDPLNGAQGVVLVIVVEATSKLLLFTLVVALVDVAVGVATVPILVEVGA